MSDSHLSFGKIVASPTVSSWSQAYNAGNLFAVISVSKTASDSGDSQDNEQSLPIIGKAVLNTLEQEYFTIENKNLAGIKHAITLSKEKIPPSLSFSFVVASLNKNVLYLFISGGGKIILKRGEKTGVLLSQKDGEDIISASGTIENNDLIVLETQTFFSLVPFSKVKDAVKNGSPSEIAETLSPLIHEREEGAASCILISYSSQVEEDSDIYEEQSEISEEKPHTSSKITSLFKHVPRINFHAFSLPSLNASKRPFLFLAFAIIIILLGSIWLTIKSKADAKRALLFKTTLSTSQKKYDEGETLLTLNKNIAREDFIAAAKTIQDNLDKFPKNSKEEKDLQSLLAKIQSAVDVSLDAKSVAPQETDKNNSLLLSTLIDHHGLFSTQDDTTVYFVDSSGISSVSKKSKTLKQIVKKDDAWKTPAGIGTFYSNIYLVDTENNQLIKFAFLDNGYAKTTYLSKDVSPDFSKAVSLGVDGALWVLRSDGSVQKFLRGNIESFSLTGLDKPFTHSIRIFTTPDSLMLYILDDGSGKILVFDKDKGAYKKQYTSPLLKKTKDFEVDEKAKKAYILSEGKVFGFELK